MELRSGSLHVHEGAEEEGTISIDSRSKGVEGKKTLHFQSLRHHRGIDVYRRTPLTDDTTIVFSIINRSILQIEYPIERERERERGGIIIS